MVDQIGGDASVKRSQNANSLESPHPSMGTLRVPIPLSLGEDVNSTPLSTVTPIVHYVRVLTVTYCLSCFLTNLSLE
jgi:hypothetical protein